MSFIHLADLSTHINTTPERPGNFAANPGRGRRRGESLRGLQFLLKLGRRRRLVCPQNKPGEEKKLQVLRDEMTIAFSWF